MTSLPGNFCLAGAQVRLGWEQAIAWVRKRRCCSEPLGQFCLSPANGIRPPPPRCTDRKGAGRRTESLRGGCRESQAFGRASILWRAGTRRTLPEGRQSHQPPELKHQGFPKAQVRRTVVDHGGPRRAKSTSIPRRSSPKPMGSHTFPPSSSHPQLPGPRAGAPRCAWTEP